MLYLMMENCWYNILFKGSFTVIDIYESVHSVR